jgi:hypothetical protein
VRLQDSPYGGGGTEGVARARARVGVGDGAVDLRLRREPIAATPLLLGTPVISTEARGTLDLPLPGPFLARALGRFGTLTGRSDENQRVGFGGGLAARAGELTEIALLYQQTAYDAPSSAGYFAPERIESLEAGGYSEYYGAWPLTLAVEAGVGVERITEWRATSASWKPAFRLWSMVAWELDSGGELRLEAEAYDTRAGTAIVPDAAAWRWGSISTSIRMPLR